MRTRELIRRERVLKNDVVWYAIKATMTYNSVDRDEAWKRAMVPAKELVYVLHEIRRRTTDAGHP